MGLLKSLYRLFWVVEVTFLAIIRLGINSSGGRWSPGLAAAHATRWAATIVNGLNMDIRVEGDLPPKGVLVVSNHRSYLDIVVILSRIEAAFLAKAELKAWPVFGLAAQKGNTVFVDRTNPISRAKARDDLAQRISQGVSVVVFPEGTTTPGPGLLPFKNGIFHMACDHNIPVVPVSVFYENPEAAWVGDDFFVPHFLKIFAASPLKARLTICPAIEDKPGGEIKAMAHSRIEAQLAIREGRLPN